MGSDNQTRANEHVEQLFMKLEYGRLIGIVLVIAASFIPSFPWVAAILGSGIILIAVGEFASR